MEAKNKNVAKKRPRAKNNAMNAPRAKNSENKVRRRQFPGDGWPPLKACYYSMLMQVFNASSLKAHWSNTPGHRRRCSGFFTAAAATAKSAAACPATAAGTPPVRPARIFFP